VQYDLLYTKRFEREKFLAMSWLSLVKKQRLLRGAGVGGAG